MVTSMADELVSVSVPRKHLTKVYGYIAQLEADASQKENHDAEWTPDLIRLAYSQSAKTMKRILWELADHPEQEVSIEQLASVMKEEANWNNVAGALGAFSRRLKSRYGIAHPPFEVSWDDNERASYRMTYDVADIIQEFPAPPPYRT
jgi:hypothetical protein